MEKMNKLVQEVAELRKSNIKKQVDTRLKEFKALGKKDSKQWFSELCFCILTANSKAETAMNIQKQLTAYGFCTLRYNDLRGAIKKISTGFITTRQSLFLQPGSSQILRI